MTAPASAPMTERALRDALGQFATGITIVTTLGPKAEPVGLTASSFNSVSLTPPLVLWSLGLKASTSAAFLAQPHFAIHVLSQQQLALAQQFAQRGVDRFAGLPWQPNAEGIPVFDGCLARFECQREQVHLAGDHHVFIGRVLRCQHNDQLPPLIYHRGQLGS